MKDHHLWGRKRPGPYTRLGNALFDMPGKVYDKTMDAAGVGAAGAMYAGNAALGAGQSAWDTGSNALSSINEWGQEHSKMDLEDHGGPPWWEERS